MTIILPSAASRPAASVNRGGAKAPGSAGFAIADPTPLPAGTPPRPIQAADMQRSLLSLQDAPDLRDEPARRGARRLLAGLAGLQMGLLAGGPAGDATEPLQALGRELEALPAAADPGLAAAIGAIALRVRIELARRGLG